MPAAKTVEIADAVVARLNLAGTFSLPFTAVRAWDVLYDLEQLDTLRVTVVAARSEEAEDAARSLRLVDHEVHVGVQKRVPAADVAALNAACDPLAALAQEVGDHFASPAAEESMHAAAGVRHVGSSVLLYDPGALREKHVFTGVVTLRYREWRDR